MDMEEMEYQIETLRSDVNNIRAAASTANMSASLDADRVVIMRADGSIMSMERLLSNMDDLSDRCTALEGMIDILLSEIKMLKEVPGFVVP